MALEYRKPDPDQLHLCPFDDTHMILASWLPYHLRKCQKNHPDLQLAVCPFNACHRVRNVELPHHILKCPDNCLLQRMAVQHANVENMSFGGKCSVPPYENDWVMNCSEDWEDDAPFAPVPSLLGEPIEVKRTVVVPLRRPKTASQTAILPTFDTSGAQPLVQKSQPTNGYLATPRGTGRETEVTPGAAKPSAILYHGIGRGLGRELHVRAEAGPRVEQADRGMKARKVNAPFALLGSNSAVSASVVENTLEAAQIPVILTNGTVVESGTDSRASSVRVQEKRQSIANRIGSSHGQATEIVTEKSEKLMRSVEREIERQEEKQ